MLSLPRRSFLTVIRSHLPAAVIVMMLMNSVCASAGDWKQFRGSSANSIAPNEAPPLELSGESIRWTADLPGRGLSGPIVVGSTVFVSASSGYQQDQLHMLAFADATGEKLWERRFRATGRTICHEKMCNATPTMAATDTHVVAFFSSNDLICTDHEGRLQWYRGLGAEFPNASNSLGMSSSPVIIGNIVIVQAESDAEAFACGIDILSGETVWQIERPHASNWTSPTILPLQNGSEIALLQSTQGLTAIDPLDGKVLWSYDDGASSIPSTTVADGLIFVVSNGITALKPSADGSSFEEIWNASRLRPSTPSPVIANGLALTLNSAGAVSAGNTQTGDREWQLRLKGPFSGTPAVANGHLYAFNEAGRGFVVRPEADSGEIVSELDLGETILCSPAIANHAVYVRSDGHLWKLAAPR